MPVHLAAPAHNPLGPDGQGHNRIEIQGIHGNQCALRPRSYATLRESFDTRHARWGGFGRCASNSCSTCPIPTKPKRELTVFGDQVLVRIAETRAPGGLLGDEVTTQPWVMNRPDGGWGEYGEPWTWEQMARLDGWTLGRQYHDAHGEGFWLHRVHP